MPEESEDMWHAYNLISIGDGVRASTIRSGSIRLRHTLRITSVCAQYIPKYIIRWLEVSLYVMLLSSIWYICLSFVHFIYCGMLLKYE